jgi:hypothetical protein
LRPRWRDPDARSVNRFGRRRLAVLTAALALLACGPASAKAAWGPTGELGAVDPGQAVFEPPEIGMSADGEAIVVWSLHGGPLIASARQPQGDWSPPQTIAPALEESGRTLAPLPPVVNAAGEALVVWHANPQGSWHIETATRTADGRWSPPRRLSEPGSETGAQQAVLDEAGNAGVLWISGFQQRVRWWSVRPAGGGWSTRVHPFGVGLASVSGPSSERLELNRADQAAFLASGEAGFLEAFKTVGEYWRTSVIRPALSAVGTFFLGSQFRLFDSGEALLVGLQKSADLRGGPSQILAFARPPGGAWSAPHQVDWFPGDGGFWLASAPSGGAALVWSAPSLLSGPFGLGFTSPLNILRVSTRDGGLWSAPRDLAYETQTMSITEPRVAVNGHGDTVVVWMESEPRALRRRLMATIRPAGGGWSAAQTLSVEDGFAGLAPRVVIDEAGNAVVVWVSTRATGPYGGPFVQTVQAAVFSSGRPFPAVPAPPTTPPAWLSFGQELPNPKPPVAIEPPSLVPAPPAPPPPAPPPTGRTDPQRPSPQAPRLVLDRLRVSARQDGGPPSLLRFRLSRAAMVTIQLASEAVRPVRRSLIVRGRRGVNGVCLCRLLPRRRLVAGRHVLRVSAGDGVGRLPTARIAFTVRPTPTR